MTLPEPILNRAALELIRAHGPAVLDTPDFERRLRARALALQQAGAPGLSDAQLYAATEGAGLGELAGVWGKIKKAVKKVHTKVTKVLHAPLRALSPIYKKLGAPDWFLRMRELPLKITEKPWEFKREIGSLVVGFLSGGWVGLAVSAATIVAQDQVGRHYANKAQKQAAVVADYAKKNAREKAQALAALGAAVALKRGYREGTPEGQAAANEFAELIDALWAQGVEPQRALAEVLAADVLRSQGGEPPADASAQIARLADDYQAQLAQGVPVASLNLGGGSAGGAAVLAPLAAGGAALLLGASPLLAAGVAGAGLLLTGRPASPPSSLQGLTPMTIPDPAARAAVARFVRWAREQAPDYYPFLVAELQKAGVNPGQLQGLGALGFWDVVGNIVNAAAGAASVYGNVKGASAQTKLVNAQIQQMRAAAQPPPVVEAPRIVGLNWKAFLIPGAVVAGLGLFVYLRRRSR